MNDVAPPAFDVSLATHEQREAARLPIVPGKITLLEAVAGSGKTTTMELIAATHPDKNFLYLCFNRANAEEARRKMPSNVAARSTHSLAHAFVGRIFTGKIGELKVIDVYEILDLDSPEEAQDILDIVGRFMQSPAPRIDDIGGGASSGTVRAAKKLWQRMIDPDDARVKIPHDGYLKLWQLERPVITGFDAIMVDEAQDTNPVVLDIVLNQRRLRTAAIVLVGDRAQAIYGWRGATNAMQECAKLADFQCSLTESFRFGPAIARRASRLLAILKVPTSVVVGRGDGRPRTPTTRALIARTNARLVAAAASHNGRIHFAATTEQAGFSPFEPYKFQEALDVYALREGRFNEVRSPYIKRFPTFSALERFAFTSDPLTGDELALDAELAGFVDLTKTLGPALPSTIQQICSMAGRPGAGVTTFTTAHRAKGLEWDHTTLTDDFVPLHDREKLKLWRDHLGMVQLTEEVHLLYVALTRARVSATLPDAFEKWFQQDSLADEWSD